MRDNSLKRERSTEASEDSMAWMEDSNSRHKVQKISQITISSMVEVASQEWPQMDI